MIRSFKLRKLMSAITMSCAGFITDCMRHSAYTKTRNGFSYNFTNFIFDETIKHFWNWFILLVSWLIWIFSRYLVFNCMILMFIRKWNGKWHYIIGRAFIPCILSEPLEYTGHYKFGRFLIYFLQYFSHICRIVLRKYCVDPTRNFEGIPLTVFQPQNYPYCVL